MGATSPSARDLAFWRTLAGSVFGVVGAGAAFAVAVGAPSVLSVLASGVAVTGGVAGVGLHVAERRAQRREDLARADGSVAGNGVGTTAPVLGGSGLADDVRVVLVVYVAADERWRQRFEVLLPGELERAGRHEVVVWSDWRRLSVRPGWHRELERAIARADGAVVLVSASLLASRFVADEELAVLRSRAIPLAFVPVDALGSRELDTLEGVSWVRDPARPLASVSESRATSAIVRIARELAGQLPEHPHSEAAGASLGAERVRRRVAGLQPGTRMGAMHDVPPLAMGEIERDELGEVRTALIAAGPGTVGITGRAVGLYGQGGIGKTVIAAAVARDLEVRRHFPDGVYWVTVGERADVVDRQLALLGRVGASRPALRARAAASSALRIALADQRCLLIADDVWSAQDAAAFDVAGPAGRVLYTTRDERVLEDIGAEVRRVEVLSVSAARGLLTQLTGQDVDELSGTADRVLEATGRVALAVALVGAAIGRGRRSWEQVADRLEGAGETFLDHPYADVFKAMQVALADDDDAEWLAERYATLAVYPQDERVPVAAIVRLWEHTRVASGLEEARGLLAEFAAAKLLVLDDDAISFHDLQHEFLLLRAGDLRQAHSDLLDAYRALPGVAKQGWRCLPTGESYIWEHLLYHLHGAGAGSAVHAVATDLVYLAVRCARDGPYAAESDVRAAARLFPDDSAIEWTVDLFTRWGHLLAGRTTPGEVAAGLVIRAQHPPEPIDITRLIALAPSPLLAARWGLPQTSDALLRTLEGHTSEVNAVAFSPDGGLLATASNDETVRLWDPATGEQHRTLEGHTSNVRAVAFSPDGGLLATASSDKTVRLWHPTTGERHRTLKGHTNLVNAVAFSPDGGLLATASADETVRLWDPETGERHRILEGHTSGVNAVAFAPGGGLLATASADRTVRLWDPETGEQLRILEGHITSVSVRLVAFSPDGGLLATASYDKTVRLWDPETGEQLRILEGHTSWVNAVAFSPDGGVLATASSDKTVRLWDPETGEQHRTLKGHTNFVNAAAFSPDGGLLATASSDETVRLWGPETGEQHRTLTGHTDLVNAVAFSPDGGVLATASSDNTVLLWDPETGEQLRALEGHTSEVRAVAFSPDGGLLATASSDKTVRLWDPETGEQLRALEGHTSEVRAVAFSPDGGLLATASSDETVRLWGPETGEQHRTLTGHTDLVNAVAFSPDGGLLATASSDNTVRLWGPETGERHRTLIGHTDLVNAVAFSPDGGLLATASNDKTVLLWEPAPSFRRRPTSALWQRRSANAVLRPGHTVSALAFAPDGSKLAAAGNDTITLWDAATGAQLFQQRIGTSIASIGWGHGAIALATKTAVAVLDVIEDARPVESVDGRQDRRGRALRRSSRSLGFD